MCAGVRSGAGPQCVLLVAPSERARNFLGLPPSRVAFLAAVFSESLLVSDFCFLFLRLVLNLERK